jgi:hypothetical protein
LAKLAIDAADLSRARALLDVLDQVTPRPTNVLALAAERQTGET